MGFKYIPNPGQPKSPSTPKPQGLSIPQLRKIGDDAANNLPNIRQKGGVPQQVGDALNNGQPAKDN